MFAFHISYQWFSLYTSSLYTPLSFFGSCSLHKGSIIISRFSIRASLQTCLFYFQSLFQGISTRWGFPDLPLPEKRHGGAFRTVPWETYPHPRGKNGRGHISCVRIQKKSLRNFFKSGGFNQNGGYLLSHCDAVPSAWQGLTSLFGMGRGGTLVL